MPGRGQARGAVAVPGVLLAPHQRAGRQPARGALTCPATQRTELRSDRTSRLRSCGFRGARCLQADVKGSLPSWPPQACCRLMADAPRWVGAPELSPARVLSNPL